MQARTLNGGTRAGWLLATVVIAGCGGGDDFKGRRGEVAGTITYHGEPIPAGSIVMFQAASGPTYSATGSVGADGTYKLSSNGGRNLPAVEYNVQISPPPSTTVSEAPDPASVDEKGNFPDADASAAPPFPAKYSSFRTSGLKFTVEEGTNVADFDLEE